MSEFAPNTLEQQQPINTSEQVGRLILTPEQAQRFGSVALEQSPAFPRAVEIGDTRPSDLEADTSSLATANMMMDAYDAGRESSSPTSESVATQTDEAWDNHSGAGAEQARAEVESAYSETEAEIEETIAESLKDNLTGLPNREALEEHVKKVGVEGLSGVVMIDLNDFKSVNDNFGGHRVGDEVLKDFAIIMQEELADIGIPARTGGDEFAAALFKSADPEKVNQALLNIKQRTSEITKPRTAETPNTDTREEWRAGASIGYVPSNEFQTLEQGLELADSSMYTDKHEGRPEGFVARNDRRV